MNALAKVIAASAVALLAAAGAQAETYEGVQPLTTERSRAEVQVGAREATRTFSPYGDLNALGVQQISGERTRAEVKTEAVKASKNFQAYGDAVNGMV